MGSGAGRPEEGRHWTHVPSVGMGRDQGDVFRIACSGELDDILREAMKQIAAAKSWNCFVVNNKNNNVFFKSLPDASQFERSESGHWDSYVDYRSHTKLSDELSKEASKESPKTPPRNPPVKPPRGRPPAEPPTYAGRICQALAWGAIKGMFFT